MKPKIKQSQSKLTGHEIRLNKARQDESIESLRDKMDNVRENPAEGLEAAIEVLRRFGQRRGYSS